MRRQRRVPFFYGWVLVAIGFLTMAVGVNARTAFSLLFPPAVIWMSTCEPGDTWAPPGGFSDCTLPGSTQLLMGGNVTTVRPVLLIACTPAAARSPTTFGTVVWPSETVICTGEPAGSIVLPGEFWASTVPGGAVAVTYAGAAVYSPAALTAASACAWVRPVTTGTVVVVARTLLITLTMPPSILTPLSAVHWICRSTANRRDPPHS